ncbi:TetR/AcrR family transcriptional regulator [Leifsonia poae]|uniref:TetR family transcriptional regulator n=1 Tax=Leifsonia poae TaxID=110933 RepID=A0A9W6HCE5_9MICO|nr:TetR/AcrR family transcriptional regulator [Leifsonia poae]GLJ77946.1 TetR family transcriptional regulator [Leifsonia poae]
MPKKGSYAKGIAKREEILTTALEVFAQKGYRRASLREIAESVGLSQAGLLHHFSSKEELFAEVLRKRDEVDVTGTDPDAGDFDAFGALVGAVRHNAEVPGLVQLYATISAEAADDDHPGHDYFVERYRTFIGQLEKHVRAEQQAGRIDPALDALQVARLGIAVADGMQVQWMLDSEADMADALSAFWDLVQRTGDRR